MIDTLSATLGTPVRSASGVRWVDAGTRRALWMKATENDARDGFWLLELVLYENYDDTKVTP